MPLYEYKCSCGKRFDRFLRLVDYKTPQICECGQTAERVISAPLVFGDYEGYSCPVTGKWIEGRRAHAENLAKHGCRVLEPGEAERAANNRQKADEQLEKVVEETAAELVSKMPSAKREQLGRELESGLDTTVVRL